MNHTWIWPMMMSFVFTLALTGCSSPSDGQITGKGGTPVPDLRMIIDEGVKSGNRTIVIPPGIYRVKPENRQHLLFKDLKNVEIIADNVEMICTETTCAITFENCENVVFRGMTVDYDPLPFTQGRITALAPDKSWFEFKLFDGYPEKLEQRIEIFDARTNSLKRGTYYGWKPIESLGQRHYKAAKADNYKFNPDEDKEEVGDIVVTNNSYAPGGSIPHAILSDRCVNLTLQNVTFYASNCFTYLESNCDKTTYRNCKIDRRAPENDTVKREYPRLRSSNADAFHSKHAVRGPQLIGCTAKYQGDDCLNICGEYYMIMGSKGNTVRILATRDINLKAGDPVELVLYTGQRLPDAKVVAIAPDGTVNAEESKFLLAQRMNKNTQLALSKPETKALAITLDRAAELPMGSVIASTKHMGNGFLVQDCDFGFNRSRGILIKASNGKVIGNKLTGNWMSSVLVTPEWWWLESGSSDDVEIRGNIITDCKDIAINVTAGAGKGGLAPAGAHNRITVADNKITGSPLPNIFASSTKGLTITGNKCVPNASVKLGDWRMRHFGLDPEKLAPVMTANCEDVTEN
jgi:hypothetical protein